MIYAQSDSINKVFGFIKKIFMTAIAFIGLNGYNAISLNEMKCVLMNSQECKVKLAMININTNESLFYPYSVLVNKCSGSCNSINNLYAKLCVPDVVKNMNIKVFYLMSKTNETRYVSWHETCACKWRLDTNVCHDGQRWNSDKCRCERRELIDKGRCDGGFIWNYSACKCECDRSCDYI